MRHILHGFVAALPRHGRVVLPLAGVLLGAFVAARLALLLAFPSAFATVAGAVKVHAFWIGVRFDLRLALAICLPLALLGGIRWISPFRSPLMRRIWIALYAVAVAVVALVFIVDAGNFAYLRARIDATMLDLVRETDTAAGMVWQTYPVIPIALGLVLIVGAFVLFARWLSVREAAREPVRIPRKGRILVTTLVVVAWICGMWGKAQWYPLRWSDAFFSTDDVVSQFALNPVLQLADTFKNRGQAYDLAAARAAYPRVAAFLAVDAPDPGQTHYSRHTAAHPRSSGPPNVIIVLLESMGWVKTGLGGNPLDTTPYLDALAREGVLWRNFYTPAFGTARSVFALVTGIPDVEVHETASRNPLAVRQHTLLTAFEGYEKFYFLGGSLNWGNIRGVLAHNVPGLRLFEEGSFQAPRVDTWGISDLAMFEEANRQFAALAGRPFVAIVQTSGNHRPYHLPDDLRGFEVRTRTAAEYRAAGIEGDEEYNGLRFLDHSLGWFLATARKEPYFANTIIAVFGDHGLPGEADHMAVVEREAGLHRVHVPLILAGCCLGRGGEVLDTVASEVDVLPTLTALAGIETMNTTLGRDLFDPRFDQSRAAFIITDHFSRPRLGLIADGLALRVDADGGRMSAWWLGDGQKIAAEDARLPAMIELARGLYETSRVMLLRNQPRRHRP